MSAFFMAGIAYQVFGSDKLNGIWLFAICLILFLLIRYFAFPFKQILTGCLAYTICFLAGLEIGRLNTGIDKASHFSNVHKIDAYIGVVNDEVNLKAKSYSAKVKVLYIHIDGEWRKASGNVLIYLPINDKKWKYGDKLIIQGTPDEISPPYHPKAFDYKKYLSYQNIYHQHFIKEGAYGFLGNDPPSFIWEWAFKTREAMSGMLKTSLGTGQEFAVASMIILGIKQSVDQELIDAYSSSGAMHVLAVSGLHVGMIFGLIQLLLGWLKKFKTWKPIFYISSLMLIWSFGLVTAFSPSVLRAVVMFTIIIVGQWIGKKGNLYNTLGLTAFVILLFDPFMLFNVGFQMSFLAVFGIAYLHPKLISLYSGQNFLLKWLWEVTSISLCAQLFTFPLALYYFNQFPTYFLLSNLWVIPLSSAILYIGIVFFLGAFWLPWNTAVGWILKYSVLALNKSMYLVSFIPGSVQRTIFFEAWEIAILYLILFSLLLLFYTRSKKWIHIAISFSFLFSSIRLYRSIQLNHTHKLIVGQVKTKPYIAIWKGSEAKIWLPFNTDSNSFFVKTQIIKPLEANGVSSIIISFLPNNPLLFKYKEVNLQLSQMGQGDTIMKGVNLVCIPVDIEGLEKYTSNTQFKKVILYNSKDKNKTSSSTWNLSSDGAYTLDI